MTRSSLNLILGSLLLFTGAIFAIVFRMAQAFPAFRPEVAGNWIIALLPVLAFIAVLGLKVGIPLLSSYMKESGRPPRSHQLLSMFWFFTSVAAMLAYALTHQRQENLIIVLALLVSALAGWAMTAVSFSRFDRADGFPWATQAQIVVLIACGVLLSVALLVDANMRQRLQNVAPNPPAQLQKRN